MNKHGVPIGIGTSGISMKFICNQLMVVLLASALWLWNMDFVNLQLSGARWLVVVGWLINFAAIPLILLVAFHRPLVQRVAGFLVRMGHKLRLVKDPEVTMLHIHTTLDSYHASFLRLTRHPRQVCIQLCLSALSVLGLMSVILCVYRAFGESGTPWQYLLTISFLLFLSASYTPLPGASGAQEGGFAVLFKHIFPDAQLFVALLLWRFSTYYLSILAGALLTMAENVNQLRRRGQKQEGVSNEHSK